MIELKDNYQDDVLDSEKNQLRKYNMIHNDDGTVSFVDATVYSQNGDNFGAKDVNDIVARIGEVSKAENIAYDDDKSVQGAIDEIKGTIGYSKKQLIPYPHYNTTLTMNGVTWTDNGDGTITANGTATADSFYFCRNREGNPLTMQKGNYILNGCAVGGSNETYYIYVINASTLNQIATDRGEGYNLQLDDVTNVGITCIVKSGTTVNNLVFKPMIRYASIEDDTYEPYVADLKSLVCGVEQIFFHESFTTSTTFKEYYKYTAKKKCIINLTYNAIYNNQPPQHSRINVGSTTISEINDTTPSSHHLLTLNYMLNAGDVVKCLSVYKGESTNQVRVVGYVQYLE